MGHTGGAANQALCTSPPFAHTSCEGFGARVTVMVYCGDCRDVLSSIPLVDAVVTDPPYGIAFMSKEWDHEVPDTTYWEAIFHRMKPGAHLLAFGGTRKFHRLGCVIEDAGFELRDTIMWTYAQGLPKSHNVSKAIDKMAGATRPVVGVNPNHRGVSGVNYEGIYAGKNTGAPMITAAATAEAKQWEDWGTGLKPAWEPIFVARKPFCGTVAANVLAHGTGALNIGACRIGPGHTNGRGRDEEASAQRRYTERGGTNIAVTPGPRGGDPAGRWPANLIHDGSDEVLALFPTSKGQLAAVSGAEPSAKTSNVFGTYAAHAKSTPRGDDGSAARFFFCAKATKKERGPDNDHPTVKPIALLQYLCRLVTPPEGTVLDPFVGSGSTLLAAKREGFSAVGIDIDPRCCDIARKRLENFHA